MIIYKATDDLSEKGSNSQCFCGIEAIETENGETVLKIPDIFPNMAAAKKYVNVFNKEALELIHLSNVIDDFLQQGDTLIISQQSAIATYF